MNVQEIAKLWKEHQSLSFPHGYAGEEINGIELAEVDATVAGCVGVFIQEGQLDLWRTAILGLCYHDLSLITQHLDGNVYEYFHRLEELSRKVLLAVRDSNDPKLRISIYSLKI